MHLINWPTCAPNEADVSHLKKRIVTDACAEKPTRLFSTESQKPHHRIYSTTIYPLVKYHLQSLRQQKKRRNLNRAPHVDSCSVVLCFRARLGARTVAPNAKRVCHLLYRPLPR